MSKLQLDKEEKVIKKNVASGRLRRDSEAKLVC